MYDQSMTGLMAIGEAPSGRILAIDFGLARIGLAVSDALGITAQGLETRERTSIARDIEHIRRIAEDYNVEWVLVGNPRGQAGQETAMSRKAADFARQLERRLHRPVELWDERFTSAEAGRMLRESGMGIQKRRRAADRVAATLLLQSYLDYQANERARQRAAEAERPGLGDAGGESK